MSMLGSLRLLFFVSLVASLHVGGPADAMPLDDGLSAIEQKDFTRAFQILEPLAKAGDATAQRLTGRMYQEGAGVEKSPSTAHDWFKKAGQQGDAEAQLAVGRNFRI